MVELTDDEKRLSYSKYFYRDMAIIPKDKMEIGQGNASDCTNVLKIQDRNKFLKGGEEAGLMVGFGVMEDGTAFVCNSTFMPRVTVEMCDWWFGWHSIGSDLRYKIWDREDHYYARADKIDYVRNPKVPCNQKTWGVIHTIKEDIGHGPEEIILNFKSPEDAGLDTSLIGTQHCNSIVCASGIGTSSAVMIHKFYEVDKGIMFDSRFWMGWEISDKKAIKTLPDGVRIPDLGPRALFNHNIKEFANLANILPEIFTEEKDNW